jgi:TIGR03943 family protein
MNYIKYDKINFEVLLKVFILAGFALFFYILIHSGRAELYVHPRIIIYMKFGIIAMVIISLVLLEELFKPYKRRGSLVPYLVFIFPLILAFTQPAKILDSTLGTESKMNLTPNSSKKLPVLSSKDTSQASLSTADTIEISDDNFYKWYNILNDDPEKYIGKNIEVRGFISKSQIEDKTQFTAARLVMTCCAADLQPIGFLCKYDKTDSLKKGRWVKISGKIEDIKKEKYIEPIINVNNMEMVDAPDQIYIYP